MIIRKIQYLFLHEFSNILTKIIELNTLRHSYEIVWENMNVLDRERFLRKRLVSEMIHIKLQNNEINLRVQNFFHHDYISILNQFEQSYVFKIELIIIVTYIFMKNYIYYLF